MAVANRLVDRLTTRRDTTRRDALTAEGDLMAAVKRRDHLAQSPDLPQTGATT